MSRAAIIFMLGSWTFVLGLTAWAFARLLSIKPRDGNPDAEHS